LHAVGADARRREVKPQPKAKAKPAAKSKPAGKSAKPASKPAAKKAAKPAAKKTPAKAAKKPSAKAPAKKMPAKKTPAKKAAPAKAAKPAAKAPAKKVAPAPKAKPAVKAAQKPPAKSAPAPAPVPAKAAPTVSAGVTLRTTKPSARLAQVTVPSMAQTLTASTAPKATYMQSMSPPVLNPPPFVAIKKDPKLANNWKTKPVDQLSDEEVLAMPDSEYMNDKQMAFFRLKLQKLKEDILNSAGETTEHLREETVIVPDPADRATIEEEHALELRTRDRERKLLKKIEQSIGRIDAGDYGYCDETGEPIGVGRLLARPTATLSLEAQQRRELKQKMFGD
jgi:DnaK suppressor protein